MIRSIAFEHFLPFRKRIELPLADQGFVLVRGRNEVSAAADANGVGKTSIMHAICYGLFGEDLKGRKADAVACRHTDGQCVVHVVLEDTKGEWTITRTRRPASLSVTGIDGVLENDDASEIQIKIESRLGLGVRTFRNAVIFGQGTFDRFSQADQAEQMRMLDEIQGIDFRTDLVRAKDWRAGLQEKLDAQANAGYQTKLRIEHLEREVATLTVARDEFTANNTATAREVSDRRKKLVENRDRIRAEMEQATDEAAVLVALKAAQSVHDAAVVEQRKADEVARVAGLDAVAAQAQEDGLVEDLNSLVDGGACPSCRRPTKTKTEQARIRKLFDPELTKLSTARLKAEATAGRLSATAKKAATATERALAALADLVPVGEDARRLIARLEVSTSATAAVTRVTQEASLQADILDATRQIETLVTTQWGGAKGLALAQMDLAGYRETEKKTAGRVAKIEAMLAIADYAVEAFGDRGLRSMMVDGIADYVNDRVREHLDVLAAGEATMTMSATTDLKKGGAKERISFKPEWSWGGNGKDDGSGGQDRRMDLAVFASVQDLAESRSARPFPLKAWDEPGDALDARGQELFVQWVAQQARTRGTGLLITHSIGIADAVTPDHTWTVVLEADGARVEID